MNSIEIIELDTIDESPLNQINVSNQLNDTDDIIDPIKKPTKDTLIQAKYDTFNEFNVHNTTSHLFVTNSSSDFDKSNPPKPEQWNDLSNLPVMPPSSPISIPITSSPLKQNKTFISSTPRLNTNKAIITNTNVSLSKKTIPNSNVHIDVYTINSESDNSNLNSPSHNHLSSNGNFNSKFNFLIGQNLDFDDHSSDEISDLNHGILKTKNISKNDQTITLNQKTSSFTHNHESNRFQDSVLRSTTSINDNKKEFSTSSIFNNTSTKRHPTENDEIICLDDNEEIVPKPVKNVSYDEQSSFLSWRNKISTKNTKTDDQNIEVLVLNSSPVRNDPSPTNITKTHFEFNDSTINYSNSFHLQDDDIVIGNNKETVKNKDKTRKRLFESLDSTGLMTSSDDDEFKIISKTVPPLTKSSTEQFSILDNTRRTSAYQNEREYSSIQYSSTLNDSGNDDDNDDDEFKIISRGVNSGDTVSNLNSNKTTIHNSIYRDSSNRANTDPDKRNSQSATPPPTILHPVSSPSGGMNISFNNGESTEIGVDLQKKYTEEELDNMLVTAKLTNGVNLKKVNQAKRDKEEYMSDIKLIINDKLLKSFEIINPSFSNFLKPIKIESTPITFNYPTIQFKRRIDCIYHHVKHTFIPIEHPYYKYEKFIGIWFEASELYDQMGNLKELINKIKSKDKDFIIILFLNGYDKYIKSLDTQVNKEFQRRLQETESSNSSSSRKKKKTNNDNDPLISSKHLELQLIELEIQTGVHQFPIKGLKDLIEWLRSFSYTISTKFRDPKHRLEFSNMGGIKSHNDAKDIMKESLNQIKNITDRNSKILVDHYKGSLNKLFHGLINGDSKVDGIRSDAFESMRLLFMADDENQLIHM